MTVIVDYLDAQNVRHYGRVQLSPVEASKLAYLDGHAFLNVAITLFRERWPECRILSVVKAVTV